MSYALTSIDYSIEKGDPFIYIFARDEGLNRKVFKVKGFKPYYYYADIFGEYPIQGIDGNFVTKKVCKTPNDVGVERERHHLTYESDILFPIRFLVDRGIRYGLDVKDGEVVPADFVGNVVLPLFLDVEVQVTDPNIFPNPRIAKWPILCVTIWCPIDGNIAEWQFQIANEEEEKEFLIFFIEIIKEFDPDIITAYNVFFDMCTIINRMKHHEIDLHELSPLQYVRVSDDYDEIKISGRNVFDYYEAYKKYKHKTLPSYELESVAEDEVGIPRSDFDYTKMTPTYLDDVADYNLLDVYRMQAMEEKLQIIGFYDGIRITIGGTFDDTLEASKYVDILLLRYANGRFLLPRKPTGKKKQDYVGAIVLPPVRGVHENVIMLDFTKMYPSILISYNISPETLRLTKPKEPHYVLPIGLRFKNEFGEPYVEWREVYFLKEPRGLLPQVALDLIHLRDDVRNEMLEHPRGSVEYNFLWHRQDALKVVLDAMYGVFAYPKFRLFMPEISASMTGKGRELEMRTMEFVKSTFTYIAFYGDTDGLYFPVNNSDPVPIGLQVRDAVNAFWQTEKDKYGLYTAPAVKLEYVFETILLAKKKRYSAMVIYENGAPTRDLKIVGFEAKRSDSAVLSQLIQKEIFHRIHELKQTKDDIVEYIREEVSKFRSRPLSEIAAPLPLKTEIKAMKNRARIKSIIYANQYLNQKIDTGSRPFEFYIKTEHLVGVDKKQFGFKEKPILPDGLPTKFSFMTWSQKEQNYITKEYIADRIAFNGVPDDRWREYIDMDAMIERVIYNKVETILQALGVSEEDRIKLYGSKSPIKKEDEEEEFENGEV